MNLKYLLLPVVLVTALMTSSCMNSIEGAISACGDRTLEELKTQNVFTEECKTAMRKILPSADNNIKNALVALGSGTLTGGKTVFFGGTSETGVPIPLPTKSQITVTAVTATGDSVLDTLRYTVNRLQNTNGAKAAITVSMDYSGSMSGTDIDQAADIFKDLYTVLDTARTPFEGSIYRFSHDVTLGSPFTENVDSLKRRVQKDPAYDRTSTALLDAMGAGITALSTRTASMKFLILSTDGGENDSRTYKDASAVYALARQHNVRIFIIATLASDLPFIRKATRETGGLYAYSGSFLGVKDDAAMLHKLISHGTAVQFQNLPAGTDSVRVRYGEKTVSFDL